MGLGVVPGLGLVNSSGTFGTKMGDFLRSVNNKNILLIKIIYNFQVLLELNTLIRSQI